MRANGNRQTPAKADHTPPGPSGVPLLGVLPRFWRDPLQFLLDAGRDYGDVVCLRLGPRRVYLLTHPDHVRHVLQENHRNYCKGALYRALIPVLGKGLLVADGDDWRRQRRLAQPAFHREQVAALGPDVVEATVALRERWAVSAARGEPLDVAAEMVQLTMHILVKAMFGSEPDEQADAFSRALVEAQSHINPRSIVSPVQLPRQVPTPGNRRLQAAQRTLDAFVYRLIDERRRSGKDTGDFLSLLLQARDEETGKGLDDGELRDQVLNMLQGGHEPTANGLAWTWYLLSKHPAAARRLQEELATVLGGRLPTSADLPKLTYTTLVLHESMRLFPPVWVLARSAVDADEIGGYRIAANSLVAVSPYVTHRLAAFWENPEGFDPERFAPERSTDRLRFAYFPFGGGPRLCMGMAYAMMESLLILAVIAQAYRLDLEPGRPVTPQPLINLAPGEIWMTVHPQASPAETTGAVPERPAAT